MSSSPNWLRTLPIKPPLPTAFLTWENPMATASFPPMTPATELVTLPKMLYVVLTAFFPAATVLARLSTASSLGYSTGTDTIHTTCCTLGGSIATLGNIP